ncbi:arsenate reductase family protein [Wenxinia marina]|uniref:Arsenate reductase n=1 Tax=Wenxinia marina DSM 24838 TaxID=1123501 RepID=A0A0D0PAH6_9RHOB|nr:ArsC/Spx/MgsR family protein [Wenxinia marina]KIQ68501.1 Arsenate reductase [Wenxinia marina DSM 24838]GGL66312.1 arsenate reductase [Wenxinia marina]
MRFLGLSNCDTCRRALSELREAGVEPEVIDVREGLTPDLAAAILTDVGEAALNRRSTTWRALPEAERTADPAALLAAHPTLLKRPAIEVDGRWSVGWDAAARARALG